MYDWLFKNNQKNQLSPGKRLDSLINTEPIVRIPGAHNAMAALLAKKSGFKALYVSGAAISASMGLPDLGALTVDELCTSVKLITRASGLPVIVDGDTGYGEIINIIRLVRELEEVGAAAIQIEDQEFPKKCGHLSNKRLISADHMAEKISAVYNTRSDLLIIARTDTAASEGIDKAIERARLYIESGADIIFPEALMAKEDFLKFSKAINVPLLANMTEFGKTPYFSAEEFKEMGFKIVIWPVSSLRVSAKAILDFYSVLSEKGSVESYVDRMQTRKELYDLIRYDEYEKLDKKISKSKIP